MSEWEGKVERFRHLLGNEFGISNTRLAHCKFRFTEHQVMTGSGFYKLDADGLRRRMLHCSTCSNRISMKHLDEASWMGYIMHPNEETKGNMLFDRKHLSTARHLWAELWRNAHP